MVPVSLVVGGDGLIGAALAETLRRDGGIVLASTRRSASVGPSRPAIDLGAPDPQPPAMPIDVAYLCAAVARLDACRRDPAGSAAVNVRGTLALARRLVDRGVPLVYLSTNQVLDGGVPLAGVSAPRAPRTEYGRQKAEAEAGVLALAGRGGRVAVLRLTKVIHPGMPLFDGWITSLKSGRPIRPFDDMAVAPVNVGTVVAAIRAVGEGGGEGIYQISANRDVTYADLARHIARRIGADEALIHPMSGASSGLLADPPPPHTALDCSRLAIEYGISASDPYTELDLVVTDASSALPKGIE